MCPPPRSNNDISVIHSIKQVYIVIYQISKKLSKSDKLGIHAHCEQITREILQKLITAEFSTTNKKLEILEDARILLEVLKHFIRTEHELKIIDEKTYIRIEMLIVETSKMTNGWIKYIQNLQTQKIPA
jgi:hypothetical protein